MMDSCIHDVDLFLYIMNDTLLIVNVVIMDVNIMNHT